MYRVQQFDAFRRNCCCKAAKALRHRPDNKLASPTVRISKLVRVAVGTTLAAIAKTQLSNCGSSLSRPPGHESAAQPSSLCTWTAISRLIVKHHIYALQVLQLVARTAPSDITPCPPWYEFFFEDHSVSNLPLHLTLGDKQMLTLHQDQGAAPEDSTAPPPPGTMYACRRAVQMNCTVVLRGLGGGGGAHSMPTCSMPSSPCACTGNRPRNCLRCYTPVLTSRFPQPSSIVYGRFQNTRCADTTPKLAKAAAHDVKSRNCGCWTTLKTLNETMLKTSAKMKVGCMEDNGWVAHQVAAVCFVSVPTAASAVWPEKTLLQRVWKQSIDIRSEGSLCSSCMTGPLKTPSCRATTGLSSCSHGRGSPRRRDTTCTRTPVCQY